MISLVQSDSFHLNCSEPYPSYARPKPTRKKSEEGKSERSINEGKSEFCGIVLVGFNVTVGLSYSGF